LCIKLVNYWDHAAAVLIVTSVCNMSDTVDSFAGTLYIPLVYV